MVPTTWTALLLLCIAVLPGATFTFGFERQASAYGVALADRVLRFAAVSVAIDAVLAWPGYLAYRAWFADRAFAGGQFAAAWTLVVVGAVGPARWATSRALPEMGDATPPAGARADGATGVGPRVRRLAVRVPARAHDGWYLARRPLRDRLVRRQVPARAGLVARTAVAGERGRPPRRPSASLPCLHTGDVDRVRGGGPSGGGVSQCLTSPRRRRSCSPSSAPTTCHPRTGIAVGTLAPRWVRRPRSRAGSVPPRADSADDEAKAS